MPYITGCRRGTVTSFPTLGWAGTVVGVWCVAVASAAGAVFSDTEFQLQDWSFTYHMHDAGGALSFTHAPSDGNPDGHLRIGLDLYDAAPAVDSGVCLQVRDAGALFVPPQQAQLRVDFSMDYSWRILERPAPSAIAELGMRFVVGCTTDQETTLGPSPLSPTGESWRTLHATFLIEGSAIGFPETFQQGLWGVAPLNFAFALAHFTTDEGAGLSSELRLDNWRVNVTAIPEPPMAILLVAGARLVLRRSSRPRFGADEKP